MGSMAERTLIDKRRSIKLPDGTDPPRIAAGMNPGMSSWIALTRRFEWELGQSVLVLGATGNAGRMAVQIAKHLGASRVIAAGRNRERLQLLPSLGADVVVPLVGHSEEDSEKLGNVAAEVDVVLDYVWGQPALDTMVGIVKARSDRSRRLSWIQIGAQAGATIELPSAVLRQANVCLMGSGQGSVGAAQMLEELPALADEDLRRGHRREGPDCSTFSGGCGVGEANACGQQNRVHTFNSLIRRTAERAPCCS